MSYFLYERRVAFSDTDAMSVVHHSNYLRYLEEARVAWMRDRGLLNTHFPRTDKVLAVTQFQVWHFRPARFDDALKIRLQAKRMGLRLRFEYAIYNGDERIAEAFTEHVPVNAELKPVKPDSRLTQTLEKEPWTETWLSNS